MRSSTPLAGYARYYAGLCARQLQQLTVAKARLDAALAAAEVIQHIGARPAVSLKALAQENGLL